MDEGMARMNVERLHVALGTPLHLCSSCRMEPVGPWLDLVFTTDDGELHPAKICRHCLSEHSPDLLREMEAELRKPVP